MRTGLGHVGGVWGGCTLSGGHVIGLSFLLGPLAKEGNTLAFGKDSVGFNRSGVVMGQSID